MATAKKNSTKEEISSKNYKIDGQRNQTELIEKTLQEDIEKKILSLKHLLEKDPKSADLKWSLFIAACNTYRCDSCLKPFPPMYIKKECKDIDALVITVLIIPNFL